MLGISKRERHCCPWEDKGIHRLGLVNSPLDLPRCLQYAPRHHRPATRATADSMPAAVHPHLQQRRHLQLKHKSNRNRWPVPGFVRGVSCQNRGGRGGAGRIRCAPEKNVSLLLPVVLKMMIAMLTMMNLKSRIVAVVLEIAEDRQRDGDDRRRWCSDR